MFANNLRCSSTVKLSNKMSCYGHTPISSYIESKSLKISIPYALASPLVGYKSPVNI